MAIASLGQAAKLAGLAERLAIAPPALPETPPATSPKMSLWRWLRSTG
jgi:hypothetical protein